MGTCCGISKNSDTSQTSTKAFLSPLYLQTNPPVNLRQAKIGPFLTQGTLSKKQVQRFSKWNKMISTPSKSSQSLQDYIEDLTRSGKFLRRVKKGPPVQYRWLAWTSILQLRQKMSLEAYFELPSSNFLTMSEIFRDLDRTFPDSPYFNKSQFGQIGQTALQRVLGKLAAKYQQVGYCQAMNYVAGFLLMVSGGSEVQTFYFLEELLTNFQLQGFFSVEMPLLKQHLWIFKKLFQEKFPKLALHFAQEGIGEQLWVLKWFMTLFTSVLNLKTTLRVWDYFLIERMKFLHKIALVIVGQLQKTLIGMEAVQACELLKSVSFQDPEDIVVQASRLRIPFQEIKKQYEDQGSAKTSTICSPKTEDRVLEEEVVMFEELDQEVPKLLVRTKSCKFMTEKLIPVSFNRVLFLEKESVEVSEASEEENVDAKVIIRDLMRDSQVDGSSGPISKVLKSIKKK